MQLHFLFNLAELLQFLHLLLPGREGLVAKVTLGMLRKMIASHELAVTERAHVFLLASVRAFVPR